MATTRRAQIVAVGCLALVFTLASPPRRVRAQFRQDPVLAADTSTDSLRRIRRLHRGERIAIIVGGSGLPLVLYGGVTALHAANCSGCDPDGRSGRLGLGLVVMGASLYVGGGVVGAGFGAAMARDFHRLGRLRPLAAPLVTLIASASVYAAVMAPVPLWFHAARIRRFLSGRDARPRPIRLLAIPSIDIRGDRYSLALVGGF